MKIDHFKIFFSTGIFSKTIAQSGTALVSFSLNENPTETAFKLGRELDFVGNDPKEFVEFLKNQSAENLLKAAEKTQRLYCKVRNYPSIYKF